MKVFEAFKKMFIASFIFKNANSFVLIALIILVIFPDNSFANEPITLTTSSSFDNDFINSTVNMNDGYYSENQNQIEDDWLPSPSKAAMLSAAFPGLGQIYNRKYWKVPIIYAGAGVLVYFFDINHNYHQKYRTAYYYRIDGNPHTVDDFPFASTDVLRRAKDYYRRNLEIVYLLAGALYILNILDASVDAHLMDFDVSEDLTMHTQIMINKHNTSSFKPITEFKMTIKF